MPEYGQTHTHTIQILFAGGAGGSFIWGRLVGRHREGHEQIGIISQKSYPAYDGDTHL